MPTSSHSPSPAPTPAESAAAWSSLTWSPGIAMPDGQLISDLIPWGDGYVGVGGIDTGSGLDVGFFTSTDGRRWTLAARQPTAAGNVLAAHVVRLGGRLLAVGQAVMDGPGEKPGVAPPLWVSDDGSAWSQLTSQTWDAAFTTDLPRWLLGGPAGVVAISSGADPVIAFSRDGSTWTRATLPVTERAVAMDAGAWSDGVVIVGRDGQPDRFSDAVVSTPPPPGTGVPAAWTSQDGEHWSEAAVEGSRVPGAGLQRVVAVRSGLLAVGVDSAADLLETPSTRWASPDGRTWSVVTGGAWPVSADPYPTFAADGEQALLVARAPDATTLAAWVTTDGSTWSRLTAASASDAPPIDCGTHLDCVRIDQAWLVPDGVIVAATEAAGGGGQRFWMATPGS